MARLSRDENLSVSGGSKRACGVGLATRSPPTVTKPSLRSCVVFHTTITRLTSSGFKPFSTNENDVFSPQSRLKFERRKRIVCVCVCVNRRHFQEVSNALHAMAKLPAEAAARVSYSAGARSRDGRLGYPPHPSLSRAF